MDHSSFSIETSNNRPSSLGHFPADRWVFDESVVKVFDDMLSRSIPQISLMREIVHRFGSALIQPNTDVVDLGCACGEGIASLIEGREGQNRFVGIDRSRPMLEEFARRFEKLVSHGTVQLYDMDLRSEYPDIRASLTLAILTLQFVPIEHRYGLLKRIRTHTTKGGGFILVEKVLGSGPVVDSLLVEQYYAHKRAMGYSQEEIDSKRRSLEGTLTPLTSAWNEDLLRSAGFHSIECIWRCINFCGWVAIA